MSKRLSTISLLLLFSIGLSLLLYPTFADWWNSFHQSQAIFAYAQQVETLDDGRFRQLWESAQTYNRTLPQRNTFRLSNEERNAYRQQLDVDGTGIMGVVEIPTIGVKLPVYHGTEEAVLQVAVGHLEWSSLPVGGEGSHCVLSGHRGLPSARLFTDLDRLQEGDLFRVRVLGETLTYEVDQIRTVEPSQLQDLGRVEGQDLCTLLTCTPYGINSHRLLVRGHRTDSVPERIVRITADGARISPMLVAPIVAVLLLPLGLGTMEMVLRCNPGKERRNEEWENG